MDENGYKDGDLVSEVQLFQDLTHKAESEDLLQLREATALVTADEFMRMCAEYV